MAGVTAQSSAANSKNAFRELGYIEWRKVHCRNKADLAANSWLLRDCTVVASTSDIASMKQLVDDR